MPKRKRRRRTKIKFYSFEGLKCQGKKELRFLKECVRYKKPLPIKPERIKTPDSYYTPDFEYPEMFIEVKTLGSFRACLGLESFRGQTVISDLQWRKIKWVALNVKPIHIVIYLSRQDKIPNLGISEPNISIQIKGGYKPKKRKR